MLKATTIAILMNHRTFSQLELLLDPISVSILIVQQLKAETNDFGTQLEIIMLSEVSQKEKKSTL